MSNAATSSPDPAKPRQGRARWIVAVVFLVAMAALTARLGVWQLSRAEQKAAIADTVSAGREAGFLWLAPHTPDAELQAWRQVAARGVWLPQFTVLLNNRNHAGRPGYWVVTPLCLSSPDAPESDAVPVPAAVACERAVAVLRGWLPRPPPGAEVDARPAIPQPPPSETIEGSLLERVPRLFELGAIVGAPTAGDVDGLAFGATLPLLQNLELSAYAQATGLRLLPVVLQQTAVAAVDGLQRDWAGPPVDVDQHRGYALQWFSFSAIALIALGVLLVKALRSRRRHGG